MNPKKRQHVPGNAGCVFVPNETCQCLRCDGEIPPQCIDHQFQERTVRSLSPMRQTVTAACPHCNTVYRMLRELRSDGWQTLDGVAVVTDSRELELVRQMLDEKNGTIRRAS